MININIDKAKEIHKNFLRNERISEFEKLDREFILTVSGVNSGDVIEIENRRQLLRDITQHELLVNSTSVDQLKTLTM